MATNRTRSAEHLDNVTREPWLKARALPIGQNVGAGDKVQKVAALECIDVNVMRIEFTDGEVIWVHPEERMIIAASDLEIARAAAKVRAA